MVPKLKKKRVKNKQFISFTLPNIRLLQRSIASWACYLGLSPGLSGMPFGF